MTGFCVRHREEYEKACHALTRMVKDKGFAYGKQQPRLTSRRGSLLGRCSLRTQTSGPEPANDRSDDEVGPHGSLDGSEAARATSLSTAEVRDDDPWSAWYQQSETAAWAARGWVDYSHGDWRSKPNYEATSEDEDDLIDILPDVIQGWMLLEKSGLDDLEKSIIQSDIKSKFSLMGVENSLRAHWSDEQVRRRDGPEKQSAHYEDEEGDEGEDVDSANFENYDTSELDPADAILYQEAEKDAQKAWAQIQQGRRTLREAREKQKEVRLGRRFYPKGKGRGGGKTEPRGAPSRGPCLRCGKDHPTRSCPQSPEAEAKPSLLADEEGEFVYYTEGPARSGQDHSRGQATKLSSEHSFQDHQYDQNTEQSPRHSFLYYLTDKGDDTGDYLSGEIPHHIEATGQIGGDRPVSLFGEHQESSVALLAGEGKMTTQQAMKAGYGVLDAGATKTMGSFTALHYAREASWRERQVDNVTEVDLTDRPVFGFADSETARCGRNAS